MFPYAQNAVLIGFICSALLQVHR
ncbi:hypothetical protein WCN63_14260 [Staphylococcus aureus]